MELMQCGHTDHVLEHLQLRHNHNDLVLAKVISLSRETDEEAVLI